MLFYTANYLSLCKKGTYMKNCFKHTMMNFGKVLLTMVFLSSCSKSGSHSSYLLATDQGDSEKTVCLSLGQMARIFAALPIGQEQMQEVFSAVKGSSSMGYDEEYTMKQLLTSPGTGVGENAVKAGTDYARPLRDLLAEYLHANHDTKAGGTPPDEILSQLELSDYQIYWPYSEDWDNSSMPIITFDPGYGSEYNEGYRLRRTSDGQIVTDTIYVDESVAQETPVWVINRNSDSEATPLPLFVPDDKTQEASVCSTNRILRMKSFTMLRHYDSWFQGASEFFIKCGSVNGFSASTEAELKLYSPSVTDFMVVVKRKYLNVERQYDAILLTNFTNQLDNLAFLITEDDGGTMTSWKCSATVKIKSKSYGFDLEIPYREKDDIVWRGQLAASFFQSEDVVTGRFGDVIIKFALE